MQVNKHQQPPIAAPIADDKIGSSVVSLALGFLMSVFFIVGIVAFLGYKEKSYTENFRQGLRLHELTADLYKFDEIQTMSARMTALTGEAHWEARYREQTEQLNRAIHDIKALDDGEKLALSVGRIEDSRLNLKKMEEQAFLLVQSGKEVEAQSLLQGTEYLQQKEVYSKGLSDSINWISAKIEDNISARQNTQSAMNMAAVAVVVLLFACWAFAFNRARNAVQMLKKSEGRIREQEHAILGLSRMKELGEMAACIAHEINNPIAIISMSSEVLMRQLKQYSDNTEASEKQVLRIKATTKRITSIVVGLRSVARDGSNDPFEGTNIRSLVGDTVEFAKGRIRDKDITLEVAEVPDLSFECRSVQISQVLLNLLNNSVDAIEKLSDRWIKIAVTINENKLRISVTDSGNGIPEKVRSQIMQPFFTTKEVGKGTGIGLSLSKGIVEQHKGTLMIDDSSPNTRFVIELPLRQDQGGGGSISDSEDELIAA